MTFAYHSTITILLYYVTKAFDAVDDLLLSQKSNNRFCFSNSSANLIYSYLTDRSQLVNVFGTFPQRKRVPCALSQGAIIGPLFKFQGCVDDSLAM